MSVIPGQILLQKDGRIDPFYIPLPHQVRFHASTAPNCIMEGGAGSGKSLAMRMDGYMRCLTIPRFRALLVRRKMPELRMSHLDHIPGEADRLGLGREAFHQTNNVLRFPNGSTFLFRQIEDDAALTDFLSSEFEAIYFDELTTFSLKQFKFLCSRLRTTIPGLEPIMRGGTNPIGQGAQWVKKYFITKKPSKSEAPNYDPVKYEALHSTIRDNPYVNIDMYTGRLNDLPSEGLRRALIDGEWVQEGTFFSEWSEHRDGRAWHVIEEMPKFEGRPIQYAPFIEVVRVIDWGYSEDGNPGVCLWFVCLTDGSAICFMEYVFKKTLPKDAAAEIKRRSAGMRVRYTVGDTQMWAEHEGPSIAEKFAVAGLSMVQADKERESGWVEVHTWLRDTVDDSSGPRPRLRFLRAGCPLTIQTIPDMLTDPKNPQDILTVGVEDDCSDDVRYFVMSRPGRSRAPAVEPTPDPAHVAIVHEIAKIKRRKRWRVGQESTRHF